MMTSIKSIFTYIHLPENEMDDMWMMEYASQALDSIGVRQNYEEVVCMLPIIDHRVHLPYDLMRIQAVAYQYKNPSQSEVTKLIESLSRTTTETIEDDGTKTITNTVTSMFTTPGDVINNQEHVLRIQHQGVLNNYQIWSESSLYNNNFRLLKMVDRPFSANFHCDNCPNFHCECEEIYSIRPNRTLETSIKEGNLCISYLKRPTNDCGDLMIPDDVDLKMALAAYIKMVYAEERMWTHEDNMTRLYYQFKREWELMRAKVKGKFILASADIDRLAQIDKPMLNVIRNPSAFDNQY